MKKYAACCALGFFCCSLFSRAACCQDFSSIDKDLSQLENLINDTLANTGTQQTQLESLKKNLSESGTIIAAYERIMKTQESSLEALRTRLDEMSETCKAQLALSAKYEQSSKFWRIFTLIAVPAAAILSGGIVWAVK